MKPFRNPLVSLVPQPHTQPETGKMEAPHASVFHSFFKVLERLKPPPPQGGAYRIDPKSAARFLD